MIKEYQELDGLGLAQLVKTGQVSPQELLETAINLTEKLNPALNCVVNKLYDEAKAQLEKPIPEGPFQGVPFLLKDIRTLLKNTVTTNGCQLFVDAKADHDSEITTRFKRAGLIIFGKTNVPELGLSFVTESRLFGACKNPLDYDRTPGGSSGGAAAAVAAKIVPMAHGSDAGGSIRVPAACCGLFGFKPSRARVPSGPDAGEGWAGLATGHVITRSVRDSAATARISILFKRSDNTSQIFKNSPLPKSAFRPATRSRV